MSHPTFLRDYQPRVSSTTLAMTWLADGRRAGYLHEGDLRKNVHFAAPVAIARAAGCVVTGIHGQPLDVAPYGLLAAADARHARRPARARAGSLRSYSSSAAEALTRLPRVEKWRTR